MSEEESVDCKPVTVLNTEEQADVSDDYPPATQKTQGAVLRRRTRVTVDRGAEHDKEGRGVWTTGETDIRLIQEVKRHPCIYNPQNPHNRDPVVKEQAWQQIAKNIDVCPEYCKLRWKSIRDRFVKTQKEIRSNGINGYRRILKPYRFTHYLGFLKKHLRKQNSRPPSYPYATELKRARDQDSLLAITDIKGMDEDDEEEEDDDEFMQGWSAVDDSTEVVSQQSSHHTGSDQQHLGNGQHSGTSVGVPSTDLGNERVLSYLDSVPAPTTSPNNTAMTRSSALSHSIPLHQEAERFDEVMHFLISLAPAMRRLAPHQQSLARIKIQSLLHEMEFNGQ